LQADGHVIQYDQRRKPKSRDTLRRACTPAISIFVTCETEEEIDTLFKKLSGGGSVFMELNNYPFSEKFGWVEDRFGVFWQLSLTRK
jgi:predicted 3-demethylubiquinone-9 3-methyltransferase (glyoxalase superfamily)